MLRVGSLARMSRRLLPFSLHAGDDSRDALSQLQALLPDARGRDADLIRTEIAALQSGAERARRRRLGSAAVVGVTCCAALQAALEGQAFDGAPHMRLPLTARYCSHPVGPVHALTTAQHVRTTGALATRSLCPALPLHPCPPQWWCWTRRAR